MKFRKKLFIYWSININVDNFNINVDNFKNAKYNGLIFSKKRFRKEISLVKVAHTFSYTTQLQVTLPTLFFVIFLRKNWTVFQICKAKISSLKIWFSSLYSRILWVLAFKTKKRKSKKTHKIKPKLNRMMFLWRCELVGHDVGFFSLWWRYWGRKSKAMARENKYRKKENTSAPRWIN